MSKHQHNRGYRIVIVPEDGRESRTISMSPAKFNFIIISTIMAFLTVFAFFGTAVYFWLDAAGDRTRLHDLRGEFDALNEQAARVAKVEQNLIEMDRYIRYIRLAMSLTGEDLPPALEDFVANDSLKRRYELTADADNIANVPNIIPVINAYVSKGFSPKDEHFGIDYAASEGQVIRATARGIVTDISVDEQLGNVVKLDHGNSFITRFAHCREIIVRKGQTVERGETIATVGNSGKSTSGPHLHYEVTKEGEPVDPQQFIVKGL